MTYQNTQICITQMDSIKTILYITVDPAANEVKIMVWCLLSVQKL